MELWLALFFGDIVACAGRFGDCYRLEKEVALFLNIFYLRFS